MASPSAEQLLEMGNSLLEDPSASAADILPLLDKAELYLSRVEQTPERSIQDALSPCITALVTDRLFKHSDINVRVAVACCICEISRINAPDAPYSEEKMKDVFQLIVSSFEHLDDMSSRSYIKRISMLETVATVKLLFVMIDLECDKLIIEMFQHFLKVIRDDHPEKIFSFMVSIMTLVIEECEEDSLPEMLSPILDVLRKDNERVLPIAKRLGEQVLQECSLMLKDYLGEMVASFGGQVDDYSEIVRTICEAGTSENMSDADPSFENEVHADENHSPSDTVSMKQSDKPDHENEVQTVVKSNSFGGEQGRRQRLVELTAGTNGKKEQEKSVANDENLITCLSQIGDDVAHPSQEEIAIEPIDVPSLSKSPLENQSAGADLPLDGGNDVEAMAIESNNVSSPSKNKELKKSEGLLKESAEPSDSLVKEDDKLGENSGEGASDKEDKEMGIESSIVSSPPKGKELKKSGELLKKSAESSDSLVKEDGRLGEGTSDEEMPVESNHVSSASKSKELKKSEGLLKESAESSDSVVKVDDRLGEDSREGTSHEGRSPIRLEVFNKKGKTSTNSKSNPVMPSKVGVRTGVKHVSTLLKDKDKEGPPKRRRLHLKNISIPPEKDAEEITASSSKTECNTDGNQPSETLMEKGKRKSKRDKDQPIETARVRGKRKRTPVRRDKEGPSKRRRLHLKDMSIPPEKEEIAASLSKTECNIDGDQPSQTLIDKGKKKSKRDKDQPVESSPIRGRRNSTPARRKSVGQSSDARTYGEDLVGLKVKVWWPMDKVFYEGVVKSFDAVKKKHKILYTDGAIERLNLKMERWEIIRDESNPNEGKEVARRTRKSSSKPSGNELKQQKLKKDSESSSKERLPRRVGRPRRAKSGNSEKADTSGKMTGKKTRQRV
ncbi:hypothetical protein SAY86_030387 [Trapa natans]|uniref:Uncharacterized protein n=1 Tax=Trapa natans TaxID=22666 RepID=A0AAN7RH35_TRANT|nr:hypothetical protein SAY86_030387 [Trapa natans]